MAKLFYKVDTYIDLYQLAFNLSEDYKNNTFTKEQIKKFDKLLDHYINRVIMLRLYRHDGYLEELFGKKFLKLFKSLEVYIKSREPLRVLEDKIDDNFNIKFG
jgi:hypothetical protein